MDLKIKDVAELLNVSETTIRRWLTEGKIPAYRLNHQYRFSRNEIEDWVLSHKLSRSLPAAPFNRTQSSSSPAKEPRESSGVRQFSLYRALHKGDVLTSFSNTTKEGLIREVSEQISPTLNADPEGLSALLLDRERLQPTALNQGIAVPHTRDFLLKNHSNAVFVAQPDQPIAYGALDGKPVHTLFFLFAGDDKSHLHLLAKIAHFCSQPHNLQFLQTHPNKKQLLEYVKEWESHLGQLDPEEQESLAPA